MKRKIIHREILNKALPKCVLKFNFFQILNRFLVFLYDKNVLIHIRQRIDFNNQVTIIQTYKNTMLCATIDITVNLHTVQFLHILLCISFCITWVNKNRQTSLSSSFFRKTSKMALVPLFVPFIFTISFVSPPSRTSTVPPFNSRAFIVKSFCLRPIENHTLAIYTNRSVF